MNTRRYYIEIVQYDNLFGVKHYHSVSE